MKLTRTLFVAVALLAPATWTVAKAAEPAAAAEGEKKDKKAKKEGAAEGEKAPAGAKAEKKAEKK